MTAIMKNWFDKTVKQRNKRVVRQCNFVNAALHTIKSTKCFGSQFSISSPKDV